MKKTLKVVLSLVVLLIIGAFIFKNHIANSGLPDYNEDIKLEGLKDNVQVYRDAFGIPHVIAQNEEDLYKVTGYILAQDRMWQMDLIRRVTQGRLSEIFGEKTIGADELFRALRIPEKSDQVLQNTDKEVITALEAFADGVNQYIENDDLPFEFKILGYKPDKWEPKHSVNFIGYMAWTLNLAWKSEISTLEIKEKVDELIFKELMVDLNYQKDVIYPDYKGDFSISKNDISNLSDTTTKDSLTALYGIQTTWNLISEYEKIEDILPQVFQGSNNWVVAGKKSTTGKPIFANDMHLGFSIPGVWYQIHQKIEGKLDVTGVSLPGQPFIVAGHNEKIAWGMTNVGADTMDFYIETINKDTTQYMFNGKWKDFIIKKDIIKVKDAESIEKTIRFTHRGPVVSGFKNTNKVISTHWTGNMPSDETKTIYKLNRAQNWDEFRDACKDFKAVSQNIAYADVDGNIGLQNSSGIPIRNGAGNQVYPGDTDKYDWKGMYDFEKLPYLFNPECGYIHSANNRTTAIDSFYVGRHFALPNRYNRIGEMIKEKEKLSIADFKNMHVDQHSVMVDNMKPIIIKALNKAELSDIETKALAVFQKWDNILSKDDSAALIFEVFYNNINKNLLKDELGEDLYNKYAFSKYVVHKTFKDGKSMLCDDVNTKDVVENLDDMIYISFSQTISFLSEKYGTNVDDWRWGDLHKLKLIHPLGKNKYLDYIFNLNRSYDAGGSFHTVNPFAYKANYDALHGASQRHIYSTANWDASQSIIPTGISDIPTSKHYCDQSELFMKGIYHDDYIGLEMIKDKAIYSAVYSGK